MRAHKLALGMTEAEARAALHRFAIIKEDATTASKMLTWCDIKFYNRPTAGAFGESQQVVEHAETPRLGATFVGGILTEKAEY